MFNTYLFTFYKLKSTVLLTVLIGSFKCFASLLGVARAAFHALTTTHCRDLTSASS